MLDKIDIRDILKDHFGTLVSYSDSKPRPVDYVLFYILPLVSAVVAAVRDFRLTDDAVAVLINALAILAGLLFNLLVLVHGLTSVKAPTGATDKRIMLSGTYANIAYAIVVALIALVPLVLIANGVPWIRRWGSWSAVFLVIHFSLTLLMILKRLHAIMTHELRAPPATKRD